MRLPSCSIDRCDCKVAAVGNYNIDMVVGRIDELPAWGTEATVPYMQVRAAGSAGYTAIALATVGVGVTCIGNVGQDSYGAFICDELATRGADVAGLLETNGVGTGQSVVIVRHDSERAFLSYNGHLASFDEKCLTEAERAAADFEQAEWALLSGYFLLPNLGYEATKRAFQRWKAMGKRVAFDPGWDPEGWPQHTVEEITDLLQFVDLFLPNEDEARALTQGSDPRSMASALCEAGAGIVAVKLGADGAYVLDGKERVHMPAIKTEAFDATGAGDSFNAGVLVGLTSRWPWDRTLKFANALAGIVVSRKADRFPTLDEVDKKMKSQEE
jgi:sugar/nucleoside kinase (ribokinase family)